MSSTCAERAALGRALPRPPWLLRPQGGPLLAAHLPRALVHPKDFVQQRHRKHSVLCRVKKQPIWVFGGWLSLRADLKQTPVFDRCSPARASSRRSPAQVTQKPLRSCSKARAAGQQGAADDGRPAPPLSPCPAAPTSESRAVGRQPAADDAQLAALCVAVRYDCPHILLRLGGIEGPGVGRGFRAGAQRGVRGGSGPPRRRRGARASLVRAAPACGARLAAAAALPPAAPEPRSLTWAARCGCRTN
jgi:hypothetical protein